VLNDEESRQITKALNRISTLFIADGHHRVESARLLRKKLKKKNKNHTGNEGYNYILSAIFPMSQLRILSYNRIVKNVRKFEKKFLPKLEKYFSVTPLDNYKQPEYPGQIILYKNNRWFLLEKRPDLDESDSLHSIKKQLDTYIIQKYIFEKILGIKDIRTSKRIIYVSGNKLISEIQNTADLHNGVAFILYPMSTKEVVNISENGLTVPPKSTWFDPKLLKGLMFWEIKS
jgi:uncharacterized protein (DUF1015 family)